MLWPFNLAGQGQQQSGPPTQSGSVGQATETETANLSELDRVVDWRLRELRRAGYTDSGARSLAERVEIDLHRAIDLLKTGCPEETALRILL